MKFYRQVRMLLLVAVAAGLLAASLPAQAAAAQCSRYYTVQRGDTLYRIGRTFQVSTADLQSWNAITNANRIYAGQQLCVGRVTTGQTYTVRQGDTLARIARAYGVSWTVLAEVNRISDPNRIYAGQVLLIPEVTIQ